MAYFEAPHVDGVMELTDEQKAIIKDRLEVIQAAFVPSFEQPVCDTFYLVSTYNFDNPEEVINGDTASDVLRPIEIIEETPETPAE